MAKRQVTVRTPRNTLTENTILDAAQRIVARGDEISIRLLASILECTPMALYRHFPDKKALLLALLDKVLVEIDFARKFKDPNQQLQFLAAQHLRVLQLNSWAIPLLFSNPAPGNAANRFGENIFKLLGELGINGKRAIQIFTAVLALNYGWAGFTANPIDLGTLGETLDKGKFPLTVKNWKYLVEVGNDKDYRLAIAKLIKV